jgi:hypothetical protein
MPPAEKSLQDTLSQSALEELQDKKAETDFSAAMCGVTILRYLTDHITTLPLGLMGRLLSANDAIMTLLPLVDSPPWVRSTKGGAKVSLLHKLSYVISCHVTCFAHVNRTCSHSQSQCQDQPKLGLLLGAEQQAQSRGTAAVMLTCHAS